MPRGGCASCGDGRVGAVRRHEITRLSCGFRPDPPPLSQLAHKMTIANSSVAKPCRRHAGQAEELFDFREKVRIHGSISRCATAHDQAYSVPKHLLAKTAPACDPAHMANDSSMDAAERALSEARSAMRREMAIASASKKGLSKASGNGETFLRDFLDAIKNDVQLGKLAKVAAQLGIPFWRLFVSDLHAAPSAEKIAEILAEAMATPPLGGWKASDAPSLAQAIEYGLATVSLLPTIPASDPKVAEGGPAKEPPVRRGARKS